MNELAAVLKKNREGRNAPNLNSAESKIICGEDGEVIDFQKRQSGANAVSEGIIEEFMLLANNAAAKTAMQKELPFIYRIHEPPAAEKLLRLSETLAGLGINVPELKPTAESLNGVLKAARELGESKGEVVNMAVLRSMMKAKYSEQPLGHFGLVMSEYTHSPLSRPVDSSHFERACHKRRYEIG
jgi:ribonuclease R